MVLSVSARKSIAISWKQYKTGETRIISNENDLLA
jgi:hypothetical protein